MMSYQLVKIDGSILEGGGQIIRNALSLSVLTKTPICITNIRAGRSKPGLMEQHLKGLELVRDISKAKTKGANLGSQEVEFWPNEIKGGQYTAPVRTAGSISLLLQVSLPCTLFADNATTLNLQGGTNCEMAPQIDYMTEVYKRVLEKFNASFDFDLVRRGYFPKGGGEVTIDIKPVKQLCPVEMLDQGKIVSIFGWSFVAGTLPLRLAHTMANSATNVLKHKCKVDIERYQESRDVAPVGNCSGIILVCETSSGCILGGSALGKRGETPEETGERAAKAVLSSIEAGACVDDYCQDQVIILMALAAGKSSIRVGEITMHTKTSIYIVELLTTAKFNIKTMENFSIIECEGIGFSRN